MSVNRYCVVMIQGTKRGKPAFMFDPYFTGKNPDKDPTALDAIRRHAKLVRAILVGTDPAHDAYRTMVREQVGVQCRVEPMVVTGVPEVDG